MRENIVRELCQILAALPSDKHACRTVNRVMRCMEAAARASAVAMVCKDPHTEELTVTHFHNIFQEAAKKYVREIGTGAIGMLFYSEPIVIVRRETTPEYYEEFKIEADYKMAIAARVSSSSGIYGFLVVYFEKEPKESPLLLEFIQAAAGLCGTALEREELHNSLEELKRYDSETGLLSYPHFTTKLEDEIAKCNRCGGTLSLVIMDIDNYKPTIKTCGANGGIQLLQELADTLKKCIRGIDVLGKFGTDEFVLYLPNTGVEKAEAVINRFREEVRSQTFTKYDLKTSLCYGIAAYRPGDSAESLLKRASFALYEARRKGKDQLVVKAE